MPPTGIVDDGSVQPLDRLPPLAREMNEGRAFGGELRTEWPVEEGLRAEIAPERGRRGRVAFAAACKRPREESLVQSHALLPKQLPCQDRAIAVGRDSAPRGERL